MLFRRALKQLRAIDDKIIYALNVSTPTASMKVNSCSSVARKTFFCSDHRFLVCNILLHTTPQARGADPKQRCLDLKTELEQNYKVNALFQENIFHYIDILSG